MKKLFLLLTSASLLVASCGKNPQNSATEQTGKEVKTEQKGETKSIKMILDLDTGIDDAMALAYAISSPDIDLIGVVTTFGNVSAQTSIDNTLAMLDLLNRKDIPVYAGADRPTGAKDPYVANDVVKMIHGNNGIGNVTIPASKRAAEKENGIDFILESAKKYGKDLYIVATGPSTNLAAALKKDPDLGSRVGKIVIMGGALIVDGNMSPYAEANVYNDPLAANELFASPTEFTMVGLDVTQRPNLTKADTQKWRDLGTPSGKAFADMVDHYIDAYAVSIPGLGGCALHDPLAVAVSVHPEYIETLKLPMKVGTDKNSSEWGRTVAVSEKMNDPKNANVEVAVNIDVDGFVAEFTETLTNLFAKN